MKPLTLTGLLLAGAALLSACAGTPNQKINGQTYKAQASELSANRSLTRYQNAKQLQHNLFVEQQRLPSNQTDTFIVGWLLKEQAYRQQDCTIQAKQVAEIEYFECRFTNQQAHVLYVLETTKNTGIAKVFVVRDGVLGTEDEQAVVKSLSQIKLPASS